MCLLTTQLKPIKAETSIEAYKVLIYQNNKFYSSSYYADYTSDIKDKNNIIETEIPEAEYIEDSKIGHVYIGFHLYLDYYVAKAISWRMCNAVIFKCVIPIGAYYFLNEDKTEIYTNQFKFIKELCV